MEGKPERFQSNSHKAKEESKKEITKIVKGPVKQKKKSVGRRMIGVFTEEGETAGSVFENMLYDVLVPAIKSTISDMISGGIEQMLYGSSKRTSNIRRVGGKSKVSYGGYSRNDRNSRNTSFSRREKDITQDLIFESRGEAEEVLDAMFTLVDEYEVASVADLKGLVGLDAKFTDESSGWTNLSRASVNRNREGYVLILPRTERIR